jgi:hypothetical protein
MEFRIAVFFLFLYYIRPQDWIGGLAGFNIMRPLIAVWAWAFFSSRSRSPAPGVLSTPHDWCMLFYFAWVVWTGAEGQSAFNGFLPLVVFYAFTLHSLVSWERIMAYLKAWNVMLLGVAVIALASLMKLDFTGAVDMTAQMQGRLCIGTWMHNNPNALGHSMSVVMPLSYLLYVWRGNVLGRAVIFPLQSGLALWCIYETQSKGAFLVSGMLMVLIFVIGRPLLVKVFALAVAITLGVSALSFLPRMSEVGSLRADEGVQGRLMAWELAKTAMEKQPAGWKAFVAYINWNGLTERKATHSSYVQVGADLGMTGMGLYLLALWAAFRTTLQAHRLSRDDDGRERCRRAVMLLILAYAASGWMINREYHTEYFLLIAVAAAIHRLCLAEGLKETPEEVAGGFDHEESRLKHPQPVQQAPVWAARRPLATALAANSWASASLPESVPPLPRQSVMALGVKATWPMVAAEDEAREPAPKAFWNRVGMLDVAVAALLTWAVIYIWEYILKNL